MLSGATGLTYEVLWSKYLTLFIGGTALSHTIVLATFMGGLAFGNALFGRLADRPGRDRLALYAVLEVGIGLFCLLFPHLFTGLSSLYVAVASQTGPTSAVNPLLKAVLSAAVIFVPCALMGGTLPVLLKYVTDAVATAGVRLSWLYFLNTVGALAGCLVGGFYIVEHWGLEQGMVLTALVNCAIGAVFYGLSRRRWPEPAAEGPAADPAETGLAPAPVAPPEDLTYSPRQARIAFWCIGAAGALTMLYELVWFRLLVLSIGGTVHSFATMLVGFIAGIAAGSYLAGRVLRGGRNALALFALCEIGIALATLVPFGWFEALPYGFFRLGSRLVHSPANYPLYMASAVAFAVLLMGLPAMLMGAALPLAGRVCVRGLDVLGRTVGNVFSINTAGNVLGALLTGLVILPALGLEGTLLLGACLSGLIGVVLLHAWRPTGAFSAARALREAWGRGALSVGPRLWPAALAVMLALVAWRAATFPRWDARLLQSGLWRWETRYQPQSFAELKRDRQKFQVLYARDGADASLMVEEWFSPQSSPDRPPEKYRHVRINGKTDASTGADLATQLFVGHLPMFFHPDPRAVMVVGLGSGATAGAVLRHPGVQADVVEISAEMIEAAAEFEAINDGVLRHPGLSLAVLDAREFLLLTRRTYDVVVSEPTNVWVPGVSLLFTQDFYEVVDRRLNPGGLFVQWLHSYVIDQGMVAATFASLTRVFPYVSLWTMGESDLVFLAGRERPRFDPEAYRARFQAVAPARGIEGPAPLLAMLAEPEMFLLNQVASGDAVRLHWLRSAATPYRDHFPRMEFEAARAQFVGQGFHMLRELDERFQPYAHEPLYIQQYLAARPLDEERRQHLASSLAGVPPPYRRLASAIAVNGHLERPRPAVELVKLPEEMAAGVVLSRELASSLDHGPQVPAAECDAYLNLAGRTLSDASSVLSPPSTAGIERRVDACAAAHPARADEFRTRLVVVLAGSTATGRALERFEHLLGGGVLQRLRPGDQAALLVTGARVLLRAGRPAEAMQCLRAALAAEPDRRDAQRLLQGVAAAAPEPTRLTRSGPSD